MISRKIGLLFVVSIGLLGACQSSEGLSPQNSTALFGGQSSTPQTSGTESFLPATHSAPTHVKPTASPIDNQEVQDKAKQTTIGIPTISLTPVLSPEPSPIPTLDPQNWMEWPVVPLLSERVKEIYQAGIASGNQPNAFSKVGDCGSTPSWFLGDFDRGPRFYNLGDYTYLQTVIDYYQGSFGRSRSGGL